MIISSKINKTKEGRIRPDALHRQRSSAGPGGSMHQGRGDEWAPKTHKSATGES
jgi:hypothetical protein